MQDDGLIASFVQGTRESATSIGEQAGQLHGAIGDSPIEDRIRAQNSAATVAVEVDATAPIGGPAETSAASNQRADAATDRLGNDGSSQTEANRTLGQVVDVFA